MFSEYASKFLSQSRAQLESVRDISDRRPPDDAPLFSHLRDDNPNQQTVHPTVPGSIYGSRRDWTSSFVPGYLRPASRQGYYGSDDDDDDDGDEDDTFLHNTKSLQSSTSIVGLHDDEPSQEFVVESHAGRSDDHEDAEHVLVDAPPPDEMGLKPFIPIDFLPRGADIEGYPGHTAFRDVEEELPDTVPPPPVSVEVAPRYDAMWANAYLACVSIAFATSLLVLLSTTGIVGGKLPLGDTMYTIIRASRGTLVMDMVVAVVISILWIFIMKNYAIAVVYSSIVLVPIGMLVLVIYPIVSANKVDNGSSKQDRAMKWTSLIPLFLGVLWTVVIYRSRQTLQRSLGMIQLASSILAAHSPALLAFSAGIVVVFILTTLVWVNMFMRLFLEGHFSSSSGKWLLDPKAWTFGALYVLLYLWTWGVISGIQRATIAVTVSQWYFYRHTFPQASADQIIRAGVQYSVTAQFGTICCSSFIALLVRLPLLVLPTRLVGAVQIFVYNFVDASALSLTSPLALVNAVINSQGLVESARTISQLRHLDQGHNNPEISYKSPTWPAYRLAKMLLSAARVLTGLAMGFGAWVHAAKYTNGGSLYGYMVGLLAGFIGWFILGATEGTLSMIVDATFVCFALDNAGKGGHCQEADKQFGTQIGL